MASKQTFSYRLEVLQLIITSLYPACKVRHCIRSSLTLLHLIVTCTVLTSGFVKLQASNRQLESFIWEIPFGNGVAAYLSRLQGHSGSCFYHSRDPRKQLKICSDLSKTRGSRVSKSKTKYKHTVCVIIWYNLRSHPTTIITSTSSPLS